MAFVDQSKALLRIDSQALQTNRKYNADERAAQIVGDNMEPVKRQSSPPSPQIKVEDMNHLQTQVITPINIMNQDLLYDQPTNEEDEVSSHDSLVIAKPQTRPSSSRSRSRSRTMQSRNHMTSGLNDAKHLTTFTSSEGDEDKDELSLITSIDELRKEFENHYLRKDQLRSYTKNELEQLKKFQKSSFMMK